METKKEFTVLSPDGFPIGMDNYPTEEAAKEALYEWVKRYEHQGYYSTYAGLERVKISLEDLPFLCEIIEVQTN